MPVKVFQPGTTVKFHCLIQFFDQAPVIHDHSIAFALTQAICAGNGLKQTVLLKFFVQVKHLAERLIKAGKPFAAHDHKIQFSGMILCLDCFFIIIGTAIALHHPIPVGNYLVVCSFICIIHALAQIRGRDHDSAVQIAKLLKAFQIPNGIPLVIGGDHSLEACIFIGLAKVLVDVQSDPFDACIRRGQPSDAAPFPGEIIPL